MSKLFGPDFMKGIRDQIDSLPSTIKPGPFFTLNPKPMSMSELTTLLGYGAATYPGGSKSDISGYMLRKYMTLPVFSEALKKATFIEGVKDHPTLRIDGVEKGQVYCHDEDTDQDPGRIVLEIAELDLTTVKLYQLTPLQFRPDPKE